MANEHPFYLAGQWHRSAEVLPVTNPWDGSVIASTWLASELQVEEAIAAAVAAAGTMRSLPAYERAAILAKASSVLSRRRTEIGRALAGEAGKPIRDALTEVDRAAMTFHVASEEARRIGGEVIPLDLAPHGKGRIGIVRRFPIGPVAAISPFNFPLNLSAHKLAPAIAAGNPIVLKPATKTPLSALFLASALEEAGLPKGALSVLPMSRRAWRPPRHRRTLQAPDVHRLVGGGLGDEGARRQEEGDPRTRRQRGRHRRRLGRRRVGGEARGDGRLRVCGPELHLRPARVRARARLRRLRRAARRARGVARRRRSARSAPPTSGP